MNSAFFLTTSRLTFRPWTKADLPLVVSLWGDPEVMRYIDVRGGLTDEQVLERLEREIATEREYGVQYWPVFLAESGEFVGCCGLRPYDAEKGIFEIGFHVCSRHWRRGYAREAAMAVMRHAFEGVGVQALFAGHNPKNVVSSSLLVSLGFTYTHDEFYEPTGLQHPSYLLKKKEYSGS